MLPLQGLTPDALAVLGAMDPAEARRVHACVQRDDFDFRGRTGVRRQSMEWLRRSCHVPSLEVVHEARSQLDPFVKFGLRAADGAIFETVRIPLERPGRYTVCVSSQVGCALACRFCATGRLGLQRNLETWEIVEQVRIVRRSLGEGRVHGVVFQGMGEPLSNLDRVLDAIRIFSEPSGLAIDGRNITVCTAGLPAGIRRLALEAPRVRLGLSLGSAQEDKRRSLMPISGRHPLSSVLDAAVHHAQVTGLAPLFAVAPLKGVSDSFEDGLRIGQLAMDFWKRSGLRPRISVIPYNSIGPEDPFERPDTQALEEFERGVMVGGYPPHRRYSGGSDVSAACGQLAAREARSC